MRGIIHKQLYINNRNNKKHLSLKEAKHSNRVEI